jgi:para-aminobenzoate synthetase component 1
VYCGAVGWIDTVADRVDLAVAIRTFTVHPGETRLGVGSGITADSDPAAEWRESELKAARLLAVAGAHAPAAPPEGAGEVAARRSPSGDLQPQAPVSAAR